MSPVALVAERAYLLSSNPDDQAFWQLRCRAQTRLLVRGLAGESPNRRSAWRDGIDDGIRAYGDAREAARGSTDALGEVEHLLAQADDDEW